MEANRSTGRRRSEEVAQRNEALVATAFALFCERGYHAVSLATIASEARVAVRTIYADFGGKAGLLAGQIAIEQRRHAARLAALELPAGPEARLRVLAGHLVERAGDSCYAALQAVVIASGDAELAIACDEAGPGQLLALLRRELYRAQCESFLNPEPSVDELLELFVALIVGPQLSRHLRPAEVGTGPAALLPMALARRFSMFLQASELSPKV